MNETFKKLNEKYCQSVKLAQQAHDLLVEFLNEAVAACGGVVKLTGFYRTHKDADDAGVGFDDQFPAEICITDKHGFNHNIYITRLYKKGETFYIDGYDYTDGEWIEGWFVTHTDSMYSDLAYFVKSVITPEKPEETKSTDTTTESETVLVGYQLVDSDESFPSEFGCWDVFRTYEDAEAYLQECLDPEEYTIVEEWATRAQAKMYRYHAKVQRSFDKDEQVWIKGVFRNSFVTVAQKVYQKSYFNNDRILITEKLDDGRLESNWVMLNRVYQQVSGTACPKCGKPLYRGHWSEDDGGPVCIHCD